MERPRQYSKIIEALASTEGGKSLKTIYRWSQFRTNESNGSWKYILGPTYQTFSHGELFTDIVSKFLVKENGRFSISEQITFMNGVICHDWGEAILENEESVGDISAQTKTRADEKKEWKIARKVIASLPLDVEIKEDLLKGYREVVEGKNEKLHHAFKAFEKTEYVMTAMEAFVSGVAIKMQGGTGFEKELPLIGRVLVFDLAKVLDVYAPEYPDSIGAFFKENAPLIDQMFAYSLPWLNSNTEWNGKEADHKGLAEKFRVKWENFKNHTI